MSLKATLDTLDGVDAAIQPLYTKQDNGKFVLTVEGMVPSARLDEFRNNNIELKRQMEQFKDVDPKRYAELLTEHKKLSEKKLIDAGEVDKVVAQRIEAMKAESDAALKKLTEDNSLMSTQLSSVLIDSTVKSAATVAGVIPTALDDVVLRAKATFQVKDGVVVALNDKGQVIYGKDGTTPLSTDEWVKNLKTSAPHLFEGMRGGGAGGSGHGGQDTSKMTATQKIESGLNAR